MRSGLLSRTSPLNLRYETRKKSELLPPRGFSQRPRRRHLQNFLFRQLHPRRRERDRRGWWSHRRRDQGDRKSLWWGQAVACADGAADWGEPCSVHQHEQPNYGDGEEVPGPNDLGGGSNRNNRGCFDDGGG